MIQNEADCDQPTGFAGAGENSIFCSCDDHVGGSYCESCNETLHPEIERKQNELSNKDNN